MTDNNHAIGNARAWAQSIGEAMAAYQQLDGDEAESVTYEGETFTDADDLRQRIEEMPLSVQVRSGWYSPGGESGDAEEFEILLSTGGPALRIYGDIGGAHSLQWQDWGTPWTDYRDTTDQQDEAISAFAGLFYLGD
jgi:hypothetical protein